MRPNELAISSPKSSYSYAVIPVMMLLSLDKQYYGWRAVYFDNGSGLCEFAGAIAPEIWTSQEEKFIKGMLEEYMTFITRSKLDTYGVNFIKTDWPSSLHKSELEMQFKQYLIYQASQIDSRCTVH